MTSRRPYLWTKQWIGGHVCVQKKILWELNSFHMLKRSFIPSNLQSCWPCDWKRSIGLISKTTTLHVHHTFISVNCFAVTAQIRRASFHLLCRTWTSHDEDFLLLLNLDMFLRNSTLEEFAYTKVSELKWSRRRLKERYITFWATFSPSPPPSSDLKAPVWLDISSRDIFLN